MVDVVGRLRVQVPHRVVTDRGEMNDGVEPIEVVAFDVPDVSVECLRPGDRGAEPAGSEEVGVEADDIVAGPLEPGDENGADVAVVTSDEYAQVDPLGTRDD